MAIKIYAISHKANFSTLENHVRPDNPVKLIDGFNDKLHLQKLGSIKTIHRTEGRPPQAPAVLLELYFYGYHHNIRRNRKLEKECSRNVELQRVLQNLQPNYPTIAIHGSKFKAVNNKKNNYNQKTIDKQRQFTEDRNAMSKL